MSKDGLESKWFRFLNINMEHLFGNTCYSHVQPIPVQGLRTVSEAVDLLCCIVNFNFDPLHFFKTSSNIIHRLA